MQPRNSAYEGTVRASFAKQGMMRLLAAEIDTLEPGRCTLTAPIRPETSQQHGYAHAGLAWSLGDSAAGYAALSLLAPGVEVLTTEMKINLLAPAAGTRLVAADIWAEGTAPRRHVATMLGTMFALDADASTPDR
jgi:uncharacterized protein (TIGR00369 family)